MKNMFFCLIVLCLFWDTNGQVVHSKCMTPRTFALAFDDGPHPTLTVEVLDVLKRYNVSATFFLLGFGFYEWDQPRYRQTVKRMFDEGHHIGSHTWSHTDLTSLSPEEIRKEFTTQANGIREIIGVNLTIFRPPFGSYNDQVVKIAKEDYNYEAVTWNLDTGDWAHPGDTPASMAVYYDAFSRNTADSSIVLQHDVQPASPQLTEEAIKYVLTQGFTFVTLSQCIGVPMYR